LKSEIYFKNTNKQFLPVKTAELCVEGTCWMIMRNGLNKKLEISRQRWAILNVVMVVGLLCMTCSFSLAAKNLKLRSYSYISPPAMAVLQKLGISQEELEVFTNKGILYRAIAPIENKRLYEGSEDALRIDIRKKSTKLLIELSVRQGVSIHYMLERWSKTRLLPIETNLSFQNVRQDLLNSISSLLDDLKSNYNSPAYKRGEMIPEDYHAEKDE
jgi:hypothetical protein